MAAAAYRSGERLVDERTGIEHDYRRRGGVESAELFLPSGSPWQPDRAAVWNMAEAAEKRKDACVAREHEVALPDELTRDQQKALLQEYAQGLAATIRPTRASTSVKVGHGNPAPYESEETTHYTVVDKDGNVVSCTTTINDSFGNKITVEGAGFLLNNEMDDFAPKPGSPNAYGLIQGEANAVAARKRPLSSMTPTIVMKDGKFWFAVGSPGGPRGRAGAALCAKGGGG